MNLNLDESKKYIDTFNTYSLNYSNVKAVICPSFTSLHIFKNMIDVSYDLGAQDVSTFAEGSYTGDVSVNMLQNHNCKYVIVGHSERRLHNNENNNIIKSKFDLLYQSPITPIFCIGENLNQRESGNHIDVLTKQIESVLGTYVEFNKDIIIAYEPVWAIGTGKSASISVIEKTHKEVKNIIENYTLNNCNIYE